MNLIVGKLVIKLDGLEQFLIIVKNKLDEPVLESLQEISLKIFA